MLIRTDMSFEANRRSSVEVHSRVLSEAVKEEHKAKTKYPHYYFSWRGKVFYTLEDPRFSLLATIYSLFVQLCTFASVALFLVETLPHYWLDTPLWITAFEYAFGAVFVLDYLGRLFTNRVWWRWIIQPFSLIDMLSSLPFVVLLFISSIASHVALIRVLRLLRVFRILRAARYSAHVRLLGTSLRHSVDALLLLVFCLAILVVFMSSLMFFAEQTKQKFNDTDEVWYRPAFEVSPFQSIFHCFWWCIVTITTTGYGDAVPVSLLGKIVASFTMVCGVVVIAFPVAVFGNQFSIQWQMFSEQRQRARELRKVQKHRLRHQLRSSTSGSGSDNEQDSSRNNGPSNDRVPSVKFVSIDVNQPPSTATTATDAAISPAPASTTSSAVPSIPIASQPTVSASASTSTGLAHLFRLLVRERASYYPRQSLDELREAPARASSAERSSGSNEAPAPTPSPPPTEAQQAASAASPNTTDAASAPAPPPPQPVPISDTPVSSFTTLLPHQAPAPSASSEPSAPLPTEPISAPANPNPNPLVSVLERSDAEWDDSESTRQVLRELRDFLNRVPNL